MSSVLTLRHYIHTIPLHLQLETKKHSNIDPLVLTIIRNYDNEFCLVIILYALLHHLIDAVT